MAAVSSTATTIFISNTLDSAGFSSSQTEKLTTYSSYFIKLPLKQSNRFLIHSSSDATQAITSDDASPETATGFESDNSVEASSLPYSLINALNVEKVLRGIAITDVDHYGRLGIQRECPYDQVPIAYRNRCEELINQGLEEEELSKKLELFKESYMILSSVEERRFYDWSLSRSDGSDKYIWPFEVDTTQKECLSPETPPQEEPDDEGPTRVIGYWMLGWLVLGAALSIALNR